MLANPTRRHKVARGAWYPPAIMGTDDDPESNRHPAPSVVRGHRPLRSWVLVVAALGLFAVWSNSFIAIGYLLGSDGIERRLDWVALTVARFVVAAAPCFVYLAVFRRAESRAVLRRHWKRLLICGVLIVPGYNLALYFGQQHGVPAPVASLTTALVPLFVLILAALFLGEHLTVRRIVGFAVAAVGMALISAARTGEAGGTYPLLVAVTALAPLCWSLYSVVSKPMSGSVSPIVWAYLGTCLGAVLVLPLLPGSTWQQWAALDGPGWLALLYLSIPCTVLGFAVWTWLLRHLPASSVGFTVFLNPPLTTLSKYLLASLAPAVFAFSIAGQEWAGGALTLLGLGIAVNPRRRR